MIAPSEWDWQKLPSAPLATRAIVWAVGAFALLVLAALLIWLPNQEALKAATQREVQLKAEYRLLANRVAALPNVEAQIRALNQQYATLIAQLPEEEELSGLLAGVNEVGIRHQLRFKTLKWQPRKHGSWLDAIPMTVVLSGDYASIGAFSADIAAMTRLVSLQDFVLTRTETDDIHAPLLLSVSATTYRYTGERITTDKEALQ
ncbi:type IV pilus inner membrane component PilO [Salinivibrio proteolyticus]|uniref:Type 4a pilus biogenesis protein PilO n=1 Tax=Salinivibrio proteolyticus TaxID=334715 RepID=A0ABY7LH52_9GAMM|nr:type 4a pilus biogenesis protein PilO [Salinivibrio proteolyticus]WBA14978.1 type 4a pilus biogenesis protein PilO [Salinivibrio proteolyticus]